MRASRLDFWSAFGGRSSSSDVNAFGDSIIVRARIYPCREPQRKLAALAAEVRRRARFTAFVLSIGCILSFAVPLASQQQPREFLSLPTPASATGFVISESGTVAAAPCRDGVLRVWSLPDGKLTQAINIKDRAVDVTTISDDGKFVAIGDHQGGGSAWDTSSGAELGSFSLAHYPVVGAFSHDGKFVAFATSGRDVRLFPRSTSSDGMGIPDSRDTVALAFSRDNSRIASVGGDTSLHVYDVNSRKSSSANTDLLNEALAIDFTADGKQIIAAGGDKVVYFIDPATGKTLRKFPKLADPIFALSVSPDGTLLCTVTLHAEGMSLPAPIILWDLASGTKKQEWTPPAGALGGGWTADGHLVIATATKDAIHLFHMN